MLPPLPPTPAKSPNRLIASSARKISQTYEGNGCFWGAGTAVLLCGLATMSAGCRECNRQRTPAIPGRSRAGRWGLRRRDACHIELGRQGKAARRKAASPMESPMESPMQTAGLIDLQVNGYAGVDFNDSVAGRRRAGPRAGGDAARWRHRLPPDADYRSGSGPGRAAGRVGPRGGGQPARAADGAGFHLEGPFLNPAPGFAGCHPPDAMLPPDPALLRRLMAGWRGRC